MRLVGISAWMIAVVMAPPVHAHAPIEMCNEIAARSNPVDDVAEARKLRNLGRRLGMKGAKLEDPCVDTETHKGCACERTALERFYKALDGSRAGTTRAGVVVFGNSLIASDGITNVMRARLVEKFGDGGRGYLLPDRQEEYGLRRRTADNASGWLVETSTAKNSKGIGVSGLRFVSEAGAKSAFAVDGAQRIELVWSDTGPLTFRFDEGPFNVLQPYDDGEVNFTYISPPAGATTLELAAESAGSVVHGLVLEKGGSGVVLDTMGVVAAYAGTWLRTDEKLFAEELAARAPSLVVLMLGGNEAKYVSWGYTSKKRMQADFDELVARVKHAAPDAACLVVGPIDSIMGAKGDDPFQQLSALDDIIELERRIALARGCAFFDLYKAMGGKGSLKRLHDAGLLHDDLTHPRERALDVLGQLITDALLAAYRASPAPSRVTEPIVLR